MISFRITGLKIFWRITFFYISNIVSFTFTLRELLKYISNFPPMKIIFRKKIVACFFRMNIKIYNFQVKCEPISDQLIASNAMEKLYGMTFRQIPNISESWVFSKYFFKNSNFQPPPSNVHPSLQIALFPACSVPPFYRIAFGQSFNFVDWEDYGNF